MMLKDKVAVVFAATGAIGSAAASAFARHGAEVHLSGRSLAKAQAVRDDIVRQGGAAQAYAVDVKDEEAVRRHVEAVAERAGRIDVSLNAMGFPAVQGAPLAEIPIFDFIHPVVTWTSCQLITARAAAAQMVRRGRGVVLTLSASPARLAIAGTGGFGVACAAVEGLSRTLAAELGPSGVRVVCIRPHRIGETLRGGADFPMPPADFEAFLEGLTLTRRLPTLHEVGETAAFLASDGAGAMTGAVANLTGGMAVD